MIRVARAQIAGLANYFDVLNRPEAARKLRDVIIRAGERIESRKEPFFAPPRPYPTVTRAGWLWLKEGSYWVLFQSSQRDPVIEVVFHEAADIPNRL